MTPDFGPHDWFNYAPLYERVVREAPPGAVLVEIGSWLGRSTCHLGAVAKQADKGLRVYAVDPGFGTQGGPDEALHTADLERFGGNTNGRLLSNLRAAGVDDTVTLIGAPSVRAARLFAPGSVWFAFIDGDHSTAAVRADIETWWPRVAPGGALAGHDYDPYWATVVAAVTDVFGRGVGDRDCPHCWFVKKE